jgi:hypothetical protein
MERLAATTATVVLRYKHAAQDGRAIAEKRTVGVVVMRVALRCHSIDAITHQHRAEFLNRRSSKPLLEFQNLRDAGPRAVAVKAAAKRR